ICELIVKTRSVTATSMEQKPGETFYAQLQEDGKPYRGLIAITRLYLVRELTHLVVLETTPKTIRSLAWCSTVTWNLLNYRLLNTREA
ncbi:hypothetical protein P5673_026551, partial [Acropora cervicornis]